VNPQTRRSALQGSWGASFRFRACTGTMNLLGTARYAVRAPTSVSERNGPPYVLPNSFRPLARAGTSQRDVPTGIGFMGRGV